MSSDDLVEKVRYEADITDISSKLRTLADRQDDLAKDTDRSTGKMHGSWDKFRSFLGSGAMWFSGIAGGMALLTPKIMDQGANLEALDKKAATVFSGGSLARVEAWAGKVAAGFGLTKSQTVAMASAMGDLFKPMGFNADQAADMSTRLGDLSGALSAWSGGKRSAAEVSDIITKSMLGERDGLKELGVAISEADLQARLAKNGQDKLTGAALDQAKALATLQLIQEKSTDAQTAWADGSMNAIKSQNESKASLKQLGETATRLVYPILEKMLPIITKLADWLGERLPGALHKVGQFFTSVLGGGKKLIEDLAHIFGTSEKTIGIVLGSIAAGLVALAVAWNAGPGLIITGIVALVAGFLWAYNNVEWFRNGVTTVFQVVKAIFEGVVVAVTKVVEAIGWLWTKSEPVRAFLVGAFATGIRIGKAAFEGFRDAIGWVWDKLDALWTKSEPVRAFLAGAFATGIGIARDVLVGMRDAAGWVWDKLQPVIQALKDVIKWAKEAIDWISKVNPVGWVENANPFGGVDEGAVRKFAAAKAAGFPGKHNGGIVAGMPGSQVLTRLLPGERVLTESQQRNQGQGGVTIQHMEVHTGGDSPRRWIDEALWRVA